MVSIVGFQPADARFDSGTGHFSVMVLPMGKSTGEQANHALTSQPRMKPPSREIWNDGRVWFIALVLKTNVPKSTEGSNPSRSVKIPL